jgi:hypothetical protein
MRNLTLSELQSVNGGHEGTAYEIGKTIGEVVGVISKIMGATAILRGGFSIFKSLF